MSSKQTTFLPPNILKKDVVFTPDHVAKNIINFLSPSGICLDPCKGDGAFFKHLPADSRLYCELSEGLDFFDFNQEVDWVIGNPPYSLFEPFLEKSFEVSKNVSFLIPTNKVFQRQKIMEMVNKFGAIKSILVYGSGQLIDFPFGFSVGNFHFVKGYKGNTKIVMGLKEIFL